MNTALNILVVDSFPEVFLTELHTLSPAVTYAPDLSREEILEHLPEVEVLVINSRIKLDEEALGKAGKLKMVCRAGVGMDHFDLPLMEKMGINVVNTPGANARPVGEQTVGMLLNLMHRISFANEEVRVFQWNREANRGTELGGKTVGIIGYGNTGTATGNCLKGFGCRVLAYDKYKSGFGNDQVEEVDMQQLYEQAQVVTLHIPLTEETHQLANDAFFDQFHHPIWFLNLARGPITDLQALLSAIESGKVLGAALDVLPNEKMHTLTPEEKALMIALYETGKVIMTPHIGGWSHESLKRINDRLLEAISRLLASGH